MRPQEAVIPDICKFTVRVVVSGKDCVNVAITFGIQFVGEFVNFVKTTRPVRIFVPAAKVTIRRKRLKVIMA